MAAGYLLHALGFVAWLGWVRWQDPVTSPSIADVAWSLSTPAVLAGLVLLVRDRWPRRSSALLLDALAVVAVASSATIAVFAVVVALLTGLGSQQRSPAVWWLAVSMIGMSAVDVVFAVQTAAGTFRPASLLSGVSVAATAAGAVAAWRKDRDPPLRDRTAFPVFRSPCRSERSPSGYC